MRTLSWMTAVLAALLLALPASARVPSPLPTVDLGIRELLFRPLLVSRRTDQDVWVIAYGRGSSTQVLRSADTGRSWRFDTKASQALQLSLLANPMPSVDFLHWFTPEVGVAAGYLGARVLRTTDAGRSWKSIPLPDDSWVQDLEHVGGRAWNCASSGRIFRTDDAGKSWHELKGSPFHKDDGCMDLSFLTPESGWAVGSRGSLWATEDGGVSWQRLSAPEQPPIREHGREFQAGLHRVVRLTAQTAWVQGTKERFLTTDGGQTWHARPRAASEKNAPLAATRAPGGQRIITAGPAGDGVPVEQWVAFLEKGSNAAAVGEDAVVAVGDVGVDLYVSGQLVRAGPPVSQGSGVLTPLQGLARKSSEAWLGWTGDQIVASHDEGRSWFQVGRVPQSPLRSLAFPLEDTVLAETVTGALLRSEDFGRTWTPSTSPMDAYDFARASGRASSPESPFDCVLTSPSASMTVRLVETGCFHHLVDKLSVKLSPDEAELSGEHSEKERAGFERKKLSRAQGERIVRDLVAAATRQETFSGCGSTTAYKAIIEWSCPSGRIQEGKVEFRASGCGETGLAAPPPDYARALGLHQAAAEVLAGASH